jgi:hypothetical protein
VVPTRLAPTTRTIGVFVRKCSVDVVIGAPLVGGPAAVENE